MEAPRYVFTVPLYDSSTEKETDKSDRRMRYSPTPSPTFPFSDMGSKQSDKEAGMMDHLDLSSEEIVKITRHRTVSSDMEDDADNPSQECCMCGIRTLERCLQCNWAPYCSSQCYNVHRPVHQFFCNPDYAALYPRLTGLDIVPASVAAQAISALNTIDKGSPIGIPSKLSDRGIEIGSNGRPSPAPYHLSELSLIQRRARLIRQRLKEAGGKPACAICGDPCTEFDQSGTDKPEKKQTEATETISDSQKGDKYPGEENDVKAQKHFAGDTVGKQKPVMPQRLVRFAGMLICTTCVEIQAGEMTS
ncbi:unnamed protein product [Calicophoron daubneyi]|uniref:MYND-type domain-containing protein n=1 Tax=Calicophoron daubneyi TaxID=300641 RepID=A0AAV2TWH7_CALDB